MNLKYFLEGNKGPDTRCNIACNIACNGVDTRCNCCVKCCRSRTCFYSCNIARNIARNVASCVRSLSASHVQGKSVVQRKITTNRGGLLFLSHGFLTGYRYFNFALKCVSWVYGFMTPPLFVQISRRAINNPRGASHLDTRQLGMDGLSTNCLSVLNNFRIAILSMLAIYKLIYLKAASYSPPKFIPVQLVYRQV